MAKCIQVQYMVITCNHKHYENVQSAGVIVWRFTLYCRFFSNITAPSINYLKIDASSDA